MPDADAGSYAHDARYAKRRSKQTIAGAKIHRFHVRPDDERDKHLLGPRSQYVHPPRIGGFILLRQSFMRALRGIVLDYGEGRRARCHRPSRVQERTFSITRKNSDISDVPQLPKHDHERPATGGNGSAPIPSRASSLRSRLSGPVSQW